MSVYLDTPEKWRRLNDYILNEYSDKVIGFDTEFDGVDFSDGDNCVGRSQLDVWSLALYDGGSSPRGFDTARGYVLPRLALFALAPVLTSPDIKKVAHNGVVDVHTCYNLGVDVLSMVDTLNVFRFLYPGKLKYSLDALGKEYLDSGKFHSFKEICGEPIFVDKEREVTVCSCGVEGCRLRKIRDNQVHIKSKVVVTDSVMTKKFRYRKIADITQSDPKWEAKIEYAAQDAVVALQLYSYAVRRMKAKNYENPF